MSRIFEEINYLNKRYAIVIDTSLSPKGLSFVTEDEDYIQAGLWNYEKGTKLPAHYHNYFERKSYSITIHINLHNYLIVLLITFSLLYRKK
mgnify:CR=1 FL=1